MKVIVQIPCYNESQTLHAAIAGIPRRLIGVESLEILVVDDGSSDTTYEAARANKVDYIVRHTRNRGLAAAFRTGIDACLSLGADIIVTMDGDHQYRGEEIPLLIAPIIARQADMVVGNRLGGSCVFSYWKQLLQQLGSCVAGRIAGIPLNDAVSGFRAMSRDCAIKLTVLSGFSYTLETLLQARAKGIAVQFVDVATNRVARPSRLFRSTSYFVSKSAAIMLRAFAMYSASRIFLLLGAMLISGGCIPVVRFLWLYVEGNGSGHVQSLVLGTAIIVCGAISLAFALLSELLSINRCLLEMTLDSTRRVEFSLDHGSGRGSRLPPLAAYTKDARLETGNEMSFARSSYAAIDHCQHNAAGRAMRPQ